MNKLHIKRLRKIVAHLRKGELAHDYFYFGVFDSPERLGEKIERKKERRVIPNCGTSECALGELPAIFKDFKYGGADLLFTSPKIKLVYGDEYKRVNYFGEEIQEFLGLTYDATIAMFFPNRKFVLCKNQEISDVIVTPCLHAKKDEVANHIEFLINSLKDGWEVKVNG